MASGFPSLDQFQKTSETVARFIQWIAELVRRRNWFMLLVLCGVTLSLLGHFLKEQINKFVTETFQGAFWASFWTVVVLIFLGALVVAVVTMPRLAQEGEVDVAERKAIKGLRPFGREDAAIFSRLQRDDILEDCCKAVTSNNYKFGILMGESGCGKTSLLQAGLWDKLTQDDSSHYGIYVRFSDQEPLETVRKAVAEQLEVPLEWLEEAENSSFCQLLTKAVEAAEKPIVLLFDQFEQFFVHQQRKEERKPFVKALTAWYQDGSLNRIKVLVSIRADLLHELYELQEALQYTLGPQDLFKLERFTAKEASKILAVVAETEDMDFDSRFVTEVVEQELAHRESGTVSPVNLQILAWMIERQKSEELRAFNRNAFQKFGGVEGLLTRFVERTLDARILPNQRQAAIKTLLALTDLERQVRAGILTLTELQAKMQGTAKNEEIKDAVSWLSRGDVRLITPQDKDGTIGYELAHERLIPSVMRLAGKELTSADKANQLLERRVNEWLGNQHHARYLFGWRELWLLRQQQPYLVWGAKRKQKERLIRLSQRRVYGSLAAVGVLVLVVGTFFGWWYLTPTGQIQQVRWGLLRGIERRGDETKVAIANALIKDNQYAQGINLINKIGSQGSRANALAEVAQTAGRLKDSALLQKALNIATNINRPDSKSNALSAIASAAAQLEKSEQAKQVLNQALDSANTIDNPDSKSNALSAIASAAAQLEESEQAKQVLNQALDSANTIDEPFFKSDALRAIASAAAQLSDINLAQELLIEIRKAAEKASASETLSDIASYQALYGDWQAALRTLHKCQEDYKVKALAKMLTHHAENKKPPLIDGAVVLAVEATPKASGQYNLSVTIQSPDQNCTRHADWWEVLSEEGKLLGRNIINTPHEFERPFTTEKTMTLDPTQTIIIRAHFSDDLDGEYYNGIDKYTTQAMRGNLNKPDSFESIRLPARFASGVEDEAEQPQGCQKKVGT